MIKVKYIQHRQIDSAIKLIERFIKINKLDIKLTINLDCVYNNYIGYVYDNDTNNIYLNLLNIDTNCKFQFDHPTARGIENVLLHEFSHILDYKFDLIEKYKAFCKRSRRFNISFYTKETKCIREEFAELFASYICNPFLIKTIDNDRYVFLNKLFKSPIYRHQNAFEKYWNNWNEQTKYECKHRYGLYIKDNIIYSTETNLY